MLPVSLGAKPSAKSPAKEADEAMLEELSEAIESGAGLPAVARAAAQGAGRQPSR